jgi:hypothetical protein
MGLMAVIKMLVTRMGGKDKYPNDELERMTMSELEDCVHDLQRHN